MIAFNFTNKHTLGQQVGITSNKGSMAFLLALRKARIAKALHRPRALRDSIVAVPAAALVQEVQDVSCAFQRANRCHNGLHAGMADSNNATCSKAPPTISDDAPAIDCSATSPKSLPKALQAQQQPTAAVTQQTLQQSIQQRCIVEVFGNAVGCTASPLRASENELIMQNTVDSWDPAGFTSNGNSLAVLSRRKTAIKHGRIAMLATLRYIALKITGKLTGSASPSAGHQLANVCRVLTSNNRAEKQKKLDTELANGRLAMMAILRRFFQDGSTESPSTSFDADGSEPTRSRWADLTPADEDSKDGLRCSPEVKAWIESHQDHVSGNVVLAKRCK
jgi:hypothetical protein